MNLLSFFFFYIIFISDTLSLCSCFTNILTLHLLGLTRYSQYSRLQCLSHQLMLYPVHKSTPCFLIFSITQSHDFSKHIVMIKVEKKIDYRNWFFSFSFSFRIWIGNSLFACLTWKYIMKKLMICWLQSIGSYKFMRVLRFQTSWLVLTYQYSHYSSNNSSLPSFLWLTSFLLKRGIYVAGLREEIVTCPEQVLDLMVFGECRALCILSSFYSTSYFLTTERRYLCFIFIHAAHRHYGETNMNLYSSRSHTIFRMVVIMSWTLYI